MGKIVGSKTHPPVPKTNKTNELAKGQTNNKVQNENKMGVMNQDKLMVKKPISSYLDQEKNSQKGISSG